MQSRPAMPAHRGDGAGGRRTSTQPVLFLGALVGCVLLYGWWGADATGLLSRTAGSAARALQGRAAGGTGLRLQYDDLAGKAFQRLLPSPSNSASKPPSPSGSPSAAATPSGSVSPPPTPAETPTPTRSPAPSVAAPAPAAAAAAVKAAPADPAEVARLYPSRKPLPPQPAPDSFEAHPKKYLMLVQGQEGFGAWNDQIWEMLDLARTLNRSFVEPCVRNSCLEPCRCGAVHDVRVGDADLGQFDEGRDPLNLKYDGYPCEPYTGHMRKFVGWSYPLGAYLDMATLRAYYPHIVRYQDWCDNVMSKDTTAGVDSRDKRWHVSQGAFCGELHDHWCDLGEAKTIGDFVFTDPQFGRPGTVPDAGIMDRLHSEQYHTIFYYGYYRGYFLSPKRGVNVPFHPGHHRAVQHFIKEKFGTTPLTVFHWRSEHVDESMLVPCANDLANLLNKFTFPATPSGARALLMSDMPAPNNFHIMWHTYVGSTNDNRHGAMDVMINKAGLLKYDAVYNDTDTGILMIRDFLLGVYADQYITCQGDFLADCAGCFRSNSNFISRLLTVRRGYEKNGMHLWFQMGQHDIATSATPRVLPDVRI